MYHERVSTVGELNDEMVIKYIKTYRILRRNGRDYLEFIRQNPGDSAGQKAGYQNIVNDIKKGGFENY